MALTELVTDVALVVAPMVLVAALVIVGPRRLRRAFGGYRWRLAAIATPVVILTGVLLVRVTTREVLSELSRRVVGTYFTGSIFWLENLLFETNPVAALQSLQTETLTSYFAFVYVYGYVFLLVFPVLAYFALSEMDALKVLLVAFTVNYGVGLILYTFFIAYGPRNHDPLLFENLLYDAYPQFRYLTDQVNENTNVFPSLHTSLSMTTLFMAWKTRETYPLWLPVCAVLAVSVVVSTMYLGIHWFSDVVAGTVLAYVSVYVGRRYAEDDFDERIHRQLREGYRYLSRHVEQVRSSGGR